MTRFWFAAYGIAAVGSVVLFIAAIVWAMSINEPHNGWWWWSLSGLALGNIGCPLLAWLHERSDPRREDE